MHGSVETGGASMLWANNLATANLSPGLPDNQWQIEVLGWFQTTLAKIQASMVEFASSTVGVSPFGNADSSAYRSNVEGAGELGVQCWNQLVRTAGDVQNFNFAGVMVIVCISVFLVVLDCMLGTVVSLVSRCLRLGPSTEAARRADSNLHLLKKALETPGEDAARDGWRLGWWDVPVQDGDVSLTNQPVTNQPVTNQQATDEKPAAS
jgi:hypothetical protein